MGSKKKVYENTLDEDMWARAAMIISEASNILHEIYLASSNDLKMPEKTKNQDKKKTKKSKR